MRRLLVALVVLTVLTAGCWRFIFPAGKPERVIVTFDWGEDIGEIISQLGFQNIAIVDRLDIISGLSCYLSKDQQDWIQEYLPVRYLEPDIQISILDSQWPTSLSVRASAVMDSEIVDWGVKRIRANEAWAVATGKGVSVGVIDTGIATNHPDLEGAVLGGVNAIDGGSYEDDNNHGTYVASVIAARRNGVGIVGVAPDVGLYAIKVLDKDGRGWSSDIVQGYQWALKVHETNPTFSMVNLSLGSYYESQAMREAMTVAAFQGMGTIAAAGNDGRRGLCYPARNDIAVCVGASGTDGERMSWSNYGPALKANGILAPGDWILAGNKSGGWQRVSGTSIATPHVTGLAALLVEMRWCERKHIFASSSQSTAPDELAGYGVVDAVKALLELMGGVN